MDGYSEIMGAMAPTVALRHAPAAGELARAAGESLRLLSYNIQTGISMSRYRHYVTHSWKHLLPYHRRLENLDRIADLLGDYDIVGLQEADAGSLRSEFINQVEYLARRAGFPFWYHQTNRRLGKITQHSLGLLSRVRLNSIDEHRLPGAIPGRGAIIAHLGEGEHSLTLIVVHLALGSRARLLQIEYLAEAAAGSPHVILMGDLNFRSRSRFMDLLIERTGLSEPSHDLNTFPSWRPHKNIDHILVSPSLTVENAVVLNYPFSDHLPVTARISLPAELRLERVPAAQPHGSA